MVILKGYQNQSEGQLPRATKGRIWRFLNSQAVGIFPWNFSEARVKLYSPKSFFCININETVRKLEKIQKNAIKRKVLIKTKILHTLF